MTAPLDDARLERIEQLLREGNDLRRQTLAMQQESIDLQRRAFELQSTLVEEQKANIARANQVNEQALAIQQKAKKMQVLVIPALVILIGYASYLLFFRLGL